MGRGRRWSPLGDPLRHPGGVPCRQPVGDRPGDRAYPPDPCAHGRVAPSVRGGPALRGRSHTGRTPERSTSVVARGPSGFCAPHRAPPGGVLQPLAGRPGRRHRAAARGLNRGRRRFLGAVVERGEVTGQRYLSATPTTVCGPAPQALTLLCEAAGTYQGPVSDTVSRAGRRGSPTG